mgnify:FL=1
MKKKRKKKFKDTIVDTEKTINDLKKEMLECAENLNFEEAAKIRDKIKILEKKELGINEKF